MTELRNKYREEQESRAKLMMDVEKMRSQFKMQMQQVEQSQREKDVSQEASWKQRVHCERLSFFISQSFLCCFLVEKIAAQRFNRALKCFCCFVTHGNTDQISEVKFDRD